MQSSEQHIETATTARSSSGSVRAAAAATVERHAESVDSLRTRNDRWIGIAAVMLAAFSFGVQGILGKYASAGGANVPTMLTLRFGIATLIVWAVALALRLRNQNHSLRQPPRKVLGFVCLGLLFVTNSLFYFLALELLPVSTTALLLYTFPALVVLWSALFFGERLTRAKLGALVLALLGCALTIDPGAAFAAGAAFSWLGVGLALGSSLSNSWYATLAAPLGRGVSGLTIAAYSMPVTALCFGGYVLSTWSFSGDMSPSAWANCLAIGVLVGGSIALYLFGIARIGASRSAIVATIEPVTAVILGALLFAEPLTVAKLVGGACIVGGIVMLSVRGRKAAGRG